MAKAGGSTILGAHRGGAHSSVGAHETGADRREPPSGVERGELAFELDDAAMADVQMRSQQAGKRVRELRDMAASHGEPAGQAGKCGPAAGDVHAAAQLLDTGSCRGQQPVVQAIDAAEEFVLSRDDELGGGRRSRRSDIGHEVGDRHVAFVTDR